jgi:hypothetical protein
MNNTRVVRYLKQPRKNSRFIITDPRGRSFQTHISLIGQAVRLPPRLAPAFFGQLTQVLTLRGIYLVQVTQVANIWCPAGITAEALKSARSTLRAACWAADVRVTRDNEQSQRVTVDVIRRQPEPRPET